MNKFSGAFPGPINSHVAQENSNLKISFLSPYIPIHFASSWGVEREEEKFVMEAERRESGKNLWRDFVCRVFFGLKTRREEENKYYAINNHQV